MFPGAACCVGLLYRLLDQLPFSVVHSVRNGNFEVPAVFLKAKQGYTLIHHYEKKIKKVL
jgi:hypothetical protein